VTFARALAFTMIRWESGGREDGFPHLTPGDPGGFTRYGIAENFNPDVDVPTLTRVSAEIMYRERYWTLAHCDELRAPFAIVTLDAAIHHGPKRAQRFLQAAVGANIDGVIGRATHAALAIAIARHGAAAVIAATIDARSDYALGKARARGDWSNVVGFASRYIDLAAYAASLPLLEKETP